MSKKSDEEVPEKKTDEKALELLERIATAVEFLASRQLANVIQSGHVAESQTAKESETAFASE